MERQLYTMSTPQEVAALQAALTAAAMDVAAVSGTTSSSPPAPPDDEPCEDTDASFLDAML
jgi:hypothetical protein